MPNTLSWWDKNVKEPVFKRWVKGENVPSRKYVRDYIIKNGYKSVIDFGAGLCEDYFGFIKANSGIHYNAVDITDQFVKKAKKTGIHIFKESSEKTHFEDMVVDVAYCRHLLEHLDYYEKTLNEMIRVSMKEVIVTFFFPPKDKEELRINNGLPHNLYSKQKIEDFLWKNDRVVDLRWEEFSKEESILFIKIC